MGSPFISSGSGLSALTKGTFELNVRSVEVQNLTPGRPVAVNSTQDLITRLISTTDLDFVPAYNPFIGTFSATNFLLNGAQVAVTSDIPAISLSSAGGTETLVNDGAGPALATKGLTAGTGITLTSSATAVTIASAPPAATTLAAARGDLVSASVLPPGARDTWSLATGTAVPVASQAYIPSIGRVIGGGAGTSNGAVYSDDGGATWVAATTAIAASGYVGYSPDLGVCAWRSGTTDVYTSVDNGVNWTTQPAFVGSGGPFTDLLWVSALSLFVASDLSASTIATSPNGVTWTLRASATRSVRGIVWTGTRLVTVGGSGVMSSADGITWVNESSTVGMLSAFYSAELGLIVAPTIASTALMYVSADNGVTFTSYSVKPDNALIRGGFYSAELGGFYFAQCGATAGLNNAWIWDGTARPFAGGQMFGLTAGSGTLGSGTGVYALYYYPLFRRFSLAMNIASTTFTAIRGPDENVAATGSGSVSGQALMMRAGTVQTDRGLSSQWSQLYMNLAAGELRHRYNSIEYPLAGVNFTRTARFDGTLSQTLFNDGVATFGWDGVNKQVRVLFPATPWFGATGFEATAYYSFSAATPQTQANEALLFLAATNYYLSSAATARTAAFDMNKATPMTMDATVWPSTGITSTTPMYQVQVRLAPSFAGNYRVMKVYTP